MSSSARWPIADCPFVFIDRFDDGGEAKLEIERGYAAQVK